MVRDFTEATKQRLSGEIDDINKSTWSPVTDFLGDLLLYGGKFIGILSLNDDMSNVESYQKHVLDMTDMTKKELEQIFEDVYKIDKDYQANFADLVGNLNEYNGRVQYLSSIIKPNFSIPNAATIRAEISPYNERMKATSSKLNETFEKEVDWAAKQAALEATKGTISSIVKGAIDIVCLPASMIKNIATGNYMGIVTDTWGIIDDVFAVGGNLVGLAVVGIGYGIGALANDTKIKHEAVKYSEAYGGVSGLTDVLKAEEEINGEGGVTTAMRKVSQTIDTASAAYGLFSGAKKMLQSPDDILDFKFGFEGYEPLRKKKMLEKYQGDYRKWQSLYRNYVKDNHVIGWKNVSTLKGYLDPFVDQWTGDGNGIEGAGKEAAENHNKMFKFWGDVYDFNEDINDWAKDVLGIAS